MIDAGTAFNIVPNQVKLRGTVRTLDEDVRNIKEINTGIYCFNAQSLFTALEKITNQNMQNEYYLTDVIKIFYNEKKKMETVELNDINEVSGINTIEQLEFLEKEYFLKEKI
jgi:bifunctional N-acetylglucosamine-1-phosphate-uridyltransferase/glucosamine-1-phosphate-acetyltransferase GlmU-like protein